jgi:hypothetical protein
MDVVPNPGSAEAAVLGCECPVHANYAGTEEPEGGWVIRESCVVHGKKKPAAAPAEAPHVTNHVALLRGNADEGEAIVPGPMWLEMTYRTYAADPEVRTIDVLCQVLSADHVTDVQRHRILDYLRDRFL